MKISLLTGLLLFFVAAPVAARAQTDGTELPGLANPAEGSAADEAPPPLPLPGEIALPEEQPVAVPSVEPKKEEKQAPKKAVKQPVEKKTPVKKPTVKKNTVAVTAPLSAKGNTKPLSDFELGRYQYCGSDKDCIIAVNGCCDCANGGVEVGINREREEAFHKRFDCLYVQCNHQPAVPVCGSGVLSCLDHKCRYFDEVKRN